MNINARVCEFVESRLKNCEALKAYFDADKLGVYYNSTRENPSTPYILYSIQEPTVADGRNLQLEHCVYLIVVNVSVSGNSLNQIREISQAIFEEFDGDISPEGFDEIQDVKASYPSENLPFDAQTSRQLYETAQTLEFYFNLND